jgi:hypothetical protein
MLLLWGFLVLSFSFAVALRDGGLHPLVPDYHEEYYYKYLRHKMTESLSISNCSIEMLEAKDKGGDDAELSVRVMPPEKYVIKKWGPRSYEKQHKRIFAQVSSNLCGSSRFRDISKGIYKRAKGCYKVFVLDKNGIRRKRFNDYGATLHPEHVRCDNTVAQSICNSGTTGIQVVSQHYRELGEYPFLVTAKRAIIGRGGMFALPCGPFGLFSSCEAVKCGVPLAANEVLNVTICRDDESKCPYPVLDKVFVLTQYDDTQIGQFMQESLPKLVYHIDFLLANPDIKIHYGFTKQPTVPAFVLPHFFFEFLGVKDRLINGTFYARELYMPREGGCQDIGYNAWEAVSMRERFLKMVGVKEGVDFKKTTKNRPSIVILTRSPGQFTQNKADYTTRRWPPEKLPLLIDRLSELFPRHDIELFSDANRTLMTCPLCQAEVFSRADIAIGFHGAGMSNAIFMKPGGLLVEVVYDYDSRHLPIIGIFPRVCDIIGLHHFSYFTRDIGLDVVKLANETATFYDKATLWS